MPGPERGRQPTSGSTRGLKQRRVRLSSEMPSRDGHLTVWHGEYAFGQDDAFFPAAVLLARKYSDREPDRRPPEAEFRKALEALRTTAPEEANVLLDQIEHRWHHPDCPPALYVLTLTLSAPEGGALVGSDGQHVQELVCTKVGEAKRTIAARIAAYKKQVLGGVPVVSGSPTLRSAIYGDGEAMLLESEVQQAARAAAPRAAKVLDDQGLAFVGDETYVGLDVVDAVRLFAQ
jgi:hypothetical protein